MPHTTYRSDFGVGRVDYDAGGVRAIHLPDRDRPPEGGEVPVGVARLVDALEAYFAGTAQFLPRCSLVAAAGTTPLLDAIYRVVAAIPPGETMTYGEVAAAVGRPRAARVVGAAMAHNPLPPVVPCHRVVGADGSLRGYGGGLAMKRALLAMERAQPAGGLALDWTGEDG